MDSTQIRIPSQLEVEELFQKVKSMKEQYFLELTDIHQRLSTKLNQLDPNLMADSKAVEQIEKMKNFKSILERFLSILQLDKQSLQHQLNFKEKLNMYEKQIINTIQAHKRIPQQQRVPSAQQQQQQMPPAQAGPTNPQGQHQQTDWRSQLQPEARHLIVNKIMNTLKRHLPVPVSIPVPVALNELHKIAVRFEEKMYNAATSQPDYLRKFSLRMLSMETNSPIYHDSWCLNQDPTELDISELSQAPAISEDSSYTSC